MLQDDHQNTVYSESAYQHYINPGPQSIDAVSMGDNPKCGMVPTYSMIVADTAPWIFRQGKRFYLPPSQVQARHNLRVVDKSFSCFDRTLRHSGWHGCRQLGMRVIWLGTRCDKGRIGRIHGCVPRGRGSRWGPTQHWSYHQDCLSFQIQGLAVTIQYLTKSFEAGTLSVLTFEALFIVPHRLLLHPKLASRHSWLKMAGESAHCPCLHRRQDANGTSKFLSLSQKISHSFLDMPML
jgi:hypothetical protein